MRRLTSEMVSAIFGMPNALAQAVLRAAAGDRDARIRARRWRRWIVHAESGPAQSFSLAITKDLAARAYP
jgi:hypothetical protein